MDSTALSDVCHVIGALLDFTLVSEAMPTERWRWLLGALLARLVVDGTSVRIGIHLVDFNANPDAPADAGGSSKEYACP